MLIRFRRHEFEKKAGLSWFRHITFQLFGELKILLWLWGILFVCQVVFWGGLLYILAHFIVKNW